MHTLESSLYHSKNFTLDGHLAELVTVLLIQSTCEVIESYILGLPKPILVHAIRHPLTPIRDQCLYFSSKHIIELPAYSSSCEHTKQCKYDSEKHAILTSILWT